MSIINLDIFLDRIKDKIKINETTNIYSILDDGERLNVDLDYYEYVPFPIEKLIVGILDDKTIKGKKDIYENDIIDYPKNLDSKYLSILCCPKKRIDVESNNVYKLIKDSDGIFCLLFCKKTYIGDLDEQEIALFLYTLQYYNLILNNYNKYGWIENFLAIIEVDDIYFIYMLKLKKDIIKFDDFEYLPQDKLENIELKKKEFLLGNFFTSNIYVEKYKINKNDPEEIETLERYIKIKINIFKKF